MKYLTFLAVLLFSMFSSCTIKPESINYNNDECAYCKMKISDIRFGAELVTSKGKIYKFDSAECLLRTYIENKKDDYAFIMVTDYSNPNKLMDASTATFFISEKQPSPMGGNLSAYEHRDDTKSVLSEKGGELFNFESLVQTYSELYQ